MATCSVDNVVSILRETNPRTLRRLPTETQEAADEAFPKAGEPVRIGRTVQRILTATGLDEIEMRSIEWLDKPLLQASAFSLLVGPKGVGKGTWLARVIAAMTQGLYGERRNVLVVSSEDSASIDIKPRLLVAEARIDMVRIVNEHIVLPADHHHLRQLALDIGNVGMIVIDPIGNHLGGKDTNEEGLVREAIGPLNPLADELSCVLLGVRHVGKSRQNGSLAAVLGSTAWVDVPRAVLMFARDDEEPDAFHVQVVAGNRSGRSAALAYRIELREVPGLKEPVTYAVELGESEKDVDDLLAATRRTSKSQAARDRILDILETEGEQESDALNARVAQEVGLASKSVQNQRCKLTDAGFVRSIPVKDDVGKVLRWTVRRTEAPRG